MALVASKFNSTIKDLPPALVGLEGPGSAFGGAFSNSKGKGRDDEVRVMKVVEWLSDWHLLAFLDGMGIFTPVCFRLPHSMLSHSSLILLMFTRRI